MLDSVQQRDQITLSRTSARELNLLLHPCRPSASLGFETINNDVARVSAWAEDLTALRDYWRLILVSDKVSGGGRLALGQEYDVTLRQEQRNQEQSIERRYER